MRSRIDRISFYLIRLLLTSSRAAHTFALTAPSLTRIGIQLWQEGTFTMAETFDCPKCGAPVKFNIVEQAAGTVTCDFCGETILIPENLRPIPPERNFRFNDSEYDHQAEDREQLPDRGMADMDDISTFHSADIETKKKHSLGYILLWIFIGISPILVLIVIAAVIFSVNAMH
jgi:uncharacterized Zn finger protein (UPF0148 family)